MLLSGEAGIGKTRLAAEVLGAADGGALFLRGAAAPGSSPFGPVVAALRRAFLRAEPEGLAACGGRCGRTSRCCFPSSVTRQPTDDRATLFEAIRWAGTRRRRRTRRRRDPARRPAVGADEAALELLAVLAPALQDMPLLIVAAYRSDEIPRAHRLRWLRNDLRRRNCLCEITLPPLGLEETTALAESVLGVGPIEWPGRAPCTSAPPASRSSSRSWPRRWRRAAGCEPGDQGIQLALDGDVPLPQTIRDAALLRAADLSPEARATAEAAAVVGSSFDLALVAELGGEAGLDELLGGRPARSRCEPGRAAFRHPLARDAIYEDIPWLRRRTLHRTVAERGQRRHAEVAAHWLAAGDGARALDSLIRAVDERAAVHAYRDAARLSRQALDRWPEGERAAERIGVLERHARFAELSGELNDAARAQREVVAARRSEGTGRALADAQRRLATIYELQGDRDRALAARQRGGRRLRRQRPPRRRRGGAPGGRGLPAQRRPLRRCACELTARAAEDAARAERIDLRARILGLQGVTRVKGGELRRRGRGRSGLAFRWRSSTG